LDDPEDNLDVSREGSGRERSATPSDTSGRSAAQLEQGGDSEESTRIRVCREVLERGPVTAAELAARLGLTPAAGRRHLDSLSAQGHVTVWNEPARSRRGRGRPARRFVGTDAGHGALSTAYEHLAVSALRYLATVAGADAVRGFARTWVANLERRYRPIVEAAGDHSLARADAMVPALSADGFAASTRPLGLGEAAIGTQLCQGHCPVQHVARDFPQLCEAETEVFSRLLGVHVQRLATLAHGEHVCTTHVPVGAIPSASTRPGSPGPGHVSEEMTT
jgi:predicted ArsR family transcriptional regulator